MANIIVAGGLGALGKAAVAELIASGHSVAIVDVAPAPAQSETLVLGGVDLADESAVSAAYEGVAKVLGQIDGVVNVAGGFIWEPVDGGTLDSWDKMYRMNLRTATVSCHAALPYLAAGASIVNVGAAAAAGASMGMAPYAASKAGVMALTESLADELKTRNIRVNAVLPTIIDTPANRKDMPDADTSTWVKPASAAKVIVFLLSDDSASITGVGLRLSLAG